MIWILTTNLLLTFSRICFSFRAKISAFCFLMRFFSNFLQAYILPDARAWHAHTWGVKFQVDSEQHIVSFSSHTLQTDCYWTFTCTIKIKSPIIYVYLWFFIFLKHKCTAVLPPQSLPFLKPGILETCSWWLVFCRAETCSHWLPVFMDMLRHLLL